MAEPALKITLATLEDLAAIPEEHRFHEILNGELTQKALPTPKHGAAQTGITLAVAPFRRRTRGPDAPGGWWFATEVEIEFAPHQVLRPDVAGWRRERVHEPPDEWPCQARPDWVAEVLSRGSERRDLFEKLRLYHEFQVPHYWILDPETRRLRVNRWQPQGYAVVLEAGAGERVRAEPFDALELSVSGLFDDDAEGDAEE